MNRRTEGKYFEEMAIADCNDRYSKELRDIFWKENYDFLIKFEGNSTKNQPFTIKKTRIKVLSMNQSSTFVKRT